MPAIESTISTKSRLKAFLSCETSMAGKLTSQEHLCAVVDDATKNINAFVSNASECISVTLTNPHVIDYIGEYEITPKANSEQIMRTMNKRMKEDVKIKKVPYYETSNLTGKTVYIASEV